LLQETYGLLHLRIQATCSRHFWQQRRLLIRLVSGTPLARCAAGLHGLEAPGQRAGHAGRIWLQKQPQQPILNHSGAEDAGQQESVPMPAGMSC